MYSAGKKYFYINKQRVSLKEFYFICQADTAPCHMVMTKVKKLICKMPSSSNNLVCFCLI